MWLRNRCVLCIPARNCGSNGLDNDVVMIITERAAANGVHPFDGLGSACGLVLTREPLPHRLSVRCCRKSRPTLNSVMKCSRQQAQLIFFLRAFHRFQQETGTANYTGRVSGTVERQI